MTDAVTEETMTEPEFFKFVFDQLKSHGLWSQGWEFSIVPEYKGYYAYTDVEKKFILFTRESWPTSARNMKETVLHEIAHALVGHGEHNLEWWDKLIDIGGRGVWVEYEDKIESIGVTVVYR